MVTRTTQFQNYSPVRILAGATYSADQTSSVVDTQGYQELFFSASFGAAGDTLSSTVYMALELEHSDDNVTFIDCVNNEVSSANVAQSTGSPVLVDANGETNQVYVFAYRGSKRYVRVVLNFVGTHTNGTRVEITAMRGYGITSPINPQTKVQIVSDTI